MSKPQLKQTINAFVSEISDINNSDDTYKNNYIGSFIIDLLNMGGNFSMVKMKEMHPKAIDHPNSMEIISPLIKALEDIESNSYLKKAEAMTYLRDEIATGAKLYSKRVKAISIPTSKPCKVQ